MSKYEIVELDSGEYAVRSKQNWFQKLLGLETYYSTIHSYITYNTPNEFTINSLSGCIRLIDTLEKRDYANRPRRVAKVIK